MLCTTCQFALLSKDPLIYILKHDPTLRGNLPVLQYIEGFLQQIRQIDEAYRDIRLISPLLPILGLPPLTSGTQCLFNNCLTISSSKVAAITHLRNIYKLRGSSSELEVHL